MNDLKLDLRLELKLKLQLVPENLVLGNLEIGIYILKHCDILWLLTNWLIEFFLQINRDDKRRTQYINVEQEIKIEILGEIIVCLISQALKFN